jgi:hypothetical protein
MILDNKLESKAMKKAMGDENSIDIDVSDETTMEDLIEMAKFAKEYEEKNKKENKDII